MHVPRRAAFMRRFLLSANFKAAEIADGLILVMATFDVAAHALFEGGKKASNFRVFALGNEFHIAIVEIADVTGYLKAGGHFPGCIAKADALHSTGKVDFARDHAEIPSSYSYDQAFRKVRRGTTAGLPSRACRAASENNFDREP